MAFETPAFSRTHNARARVGRLRLLRFDILEMPFAMAQLARKGV
jgi:hypothetical protein